MCHPKNKYFSTHYIRHQFVVKNYFLLVFVDTPYMIMMTVYETKFPYLVKMGVLQPYY
jgi:hypothetical protein